MEKEKYYIVSLSGGKDSIAMLLRLLEENIQVDEIIFCDTGLEFPAMYRHLDKLEKETGRRITRLKAANTFEYMMFDAPVRRADKKSFVQKFGQNYTGYSWPGPKSRWCTSRLKDTPREQYLKRLRQQYEIYEFIGIAADEEYRFERKNFQNKFHRYPLVEWGMTERDCLDYCYAHGYDWEGLYQHFSRVSCWCCPLQSLEELRKLRRYYPNLWEQLKMWDKRTWRNFRADFSVEQLEARFLFEEECQKAGKSITNKQFFTELSKRLKGVT